MEARRQSRQLPSIVAHEYRNEPRDSVVAGGKGLRVPGSAAGHHNDERIISPDVPAKVMMMMMMIVMMMMMMLMLLRDI